jgi:ParD-like antitoxin of type II bacterial toxin-antitoxin system
MLVSIKLSDSLVEDAKSASKITKRTSSGQLEYWTRLGKACDENPDLPVPMLEDILASKVEMSLNKLSRFQFGIGVCRCRHIG